MEAKRFQNRKLLVSVFNAQEAREAVLGGARIVDSEDPKSALGNIKPRHIMAISDAVLNYCRDRDVQLSTNIGEDQLLFKRSGTGHAIEKSPYEIAGKAAQAAIGVTCAMGTRVHPCNLVKVGLDAMELGLLKEILEEVVLTLNRTEEFCHSQVMSVLFVQDLDLWEKRRSEDEVRSALVALREFYSTDQGEDVFDLTDYAVGNLRDRDGKPLFTHRDQVSLHSLIDKGVLAEGAPNSNVRLNDLFSHADFGITSSKKARKTDKEAIKNMVDATADAGADAIMLDTSILTKTARISLFKTSGDKECVDLNRFDDNDGKSLPREGILGLDEIRFFVDYCHYRGVEANLAGSLYSYHAQQLWALVPEADQLSTRGGSTAVLRNPWEQSLGLDNRRDRVTKRGLVRGLVPPEQNGCLNISDTLRNRAGAKEAIAALRQRLPDLPAFWTDSEGRQTEM